MQNRIPIGRALLILIHHHQDKKNDEEQTKELNRLKKIYLSGINSNEDLTFVKEWLKDPILKKKNYEIAYIEKNDKYREYKLLNIDEQKTSNPILAYRIS